MNRLYKIITFTVLATICSATDSDTEASPRQTIPLKTGWKFTKGDPQEAHRINFDDKDWRVVRVPHDWSIEGPYTEDAPTGGSGGYLPTGIGWYRKRFSLPADTQRRQVWVEFDGVYENSEVWINEHLLGKRPYGYISFYYDLTPYLREGENLLAVRVDNSHQPNTRWYSGSGIYRQARLVIVDPVHVAHWGVYITTPDVSETFATLVMQTTIENDGTLVAERGTLRSRLFDPQGDEVARIESSFTLEPQQDKKLEQMITIESPERWSVQAPVLYTLHTEIINDGRKADGLDTPIGIRKVEYDAEQGFLLNDQRIKMNGVCLHHDGGCVGAAVPIGVWERRLHKLKAMGCNAIRTSHNPAAPEFLDLCDRLGLLVQNEIFDEWRIAKREWAYHRYFDEWSQRDLTDFIHRDRNHPSVVMWSAGNEIGEQSQDDGRGHVVLQALLDTFHREDPTRPVTTGNDHISADGGTATFAFLSRLDIVGYNYMDRWHERRELYNTQDKIDHPDWLFVGTESSSVRGLRGGYSLGSDPQRVQANYTSGMIRAEQLWKYVSTRNYIIGDFMWTGIDYLGESRWPGKHAGAGVLDLCGFPKDGYYFYQSQWTDEPMIHLFPHWTWPGREGQFIPVVAYTNCDTVELYLNDKFIGQKAKQFPRPGNAGRWNRYDQQPVRATTADLHLSWDVPYEPGVLRAVGKRQDQIVCTQEIRTVGRPNAVRLIVDRDAIQADGTNVAHVRVEIVDKESHVVPTADHLVAFSIDGPGHLLGVNNGDPGDHDSYQVPQRKVFNGVALAIIQATEQRGAIHFHAASEGLQEHSVEIQVE